jgi:pimeloyl-ACP methyl ester carboxylesterase
MIHVFHGFLGSPRDFAFLGPAVTLHDLYAATDLPTVTPEDTLIGYSMGGRIALEFARAARYNLKHLVLVNAHPGLATDDERRDRRTFEETVLRNLETQGRADFLRWWNALPVFAHDAPIDPDEEIFRKSPDLFRRYRLSEQRNHLEELARHRDKVLYVAGLFDEKYMELVSDVLLPRELRVRGVPGGHRLFQTPDALEAVLREEGIL